MPSKTFDGSDASSAHTPLHRLPKGSRARVVEIAASALFGDMDDQVTLRLKELGFLPGATLQVIGFGLFGTDPIAVRINGTKFGLRRAEAEKVLAILHSA
ncbi:FeoA-like protein [Azotobacter vinelandii CA]|uniref:FeoA-like protein n=2 Tax=Azotobacter vinelandii TaxID=354 RepID=C1DJ36_AZOVD|nr:FeoA family protein [Azotobacter vinelandii]ACO80855.1 FeoA-like protein [Azotobacter vinelandii DJ]AGK15870.1 FeoA-like protein [Azotobacter vinelandii CA]AGK22199.1 FeoA-like protein [Azotobacter vinelandii CA6]WKN21650.1 ferrous iron transport protein A [Azotobacter vinelandii]SFX01676.1 ferrous iron transport protein A [Azotobacter vinelandii]